MGATARFGLKYIDRGQPMRDTRAQLQANAETTEAALTKVYARANDLVTLLPGGQTFIGIDIDGNPYVKRSGSVSNPAAIGIDTDGNPYVVRLDPEGI